MSELHWTGAAVLLALAVGSGSGRPRRPEVRTWADFACGHNSDAASQPVHEEPAPPTALWARRDHPRDTPRDRAS
jgi:hypothetical protein